MKEKYEGNINEGKEGGRKRQPARTALLLRILRDAFCSRAKKMMKKYIENQIIKSAWRKKKKNGVPHAI